MNVTLAESGNIEETKRRGEGSRTIVSAVIEEGARRLHGVSDVARLDAELLVAHSLQVARVELFRNADRVLTSSEREKIDGLFLRRERHEPIAYILGEKEFFSRQFEITPDVLIPRPETEELVDHLLRSVQSRKRSEGNRPLRVVDVGTGSGVIAITIERELSDLGIPVEMSATEQSLSALSVAEANALRWGSKIRFCQCDLLSGLSDKTFDLIVANLPYLPSEAIASLDPTVRDFEPRAALDGGTDGASVINRLVRQALPRLSTAGELWLEIGTVRKIEIPIGWGSEVRQDLSGKDRMMKVTRNG